jgi:hypothetical protein
MASSGLGQLASLIYLLLNSLKIAGIDLFLLFILVFGSRT